MINVNLGIRKIMIKLDLCAQTRHAGRYLLALKEPRSDLDDQPL